MSEEKPMTVEDLKGEITDLISCILSDLTATKRGDRLSYEIWEERGDRLSYEIIGQYLRDAQERLDSILKIV